MDGFVSRRNLDPGAFAGANTVDLSVVDISTVRLIANLVEKDFKRIVVGATGDGRGRRLPGRAVHGRVSRVAPVFDPATRTATMEIEVPNPGFRLKPGMYARVRLTADRKPNALTVPRNAVVDIEGKRGVFPVDGDVAQFQAVQTGLVRRRAHRDARRPRRKARASSPSGALALRDGDRDFSEWRWSGAAVAARTARRPRRPRTRRRGADRTGRPEARRQLTFDRPKEIRR